jgi:peptidoglycan/LPS O-acetylase OafA/YrhL
MQRLIFANQLRGFAALSVVGSHWIGVYWGSPDAVMQATATPLPSGPVPAIFDLFAHPWLNFGPLGVAVFFLISGLVIPISLSAHDRVGFLLARALRIYPTYIAGLLLCAVMVRLNAAYWQLPMPFGRLALLLNATLIFDMIGRASIDMVNWTLATELKFYILMMLAAPLIRRGNLAVLFVISGLGLCYNLAWSRHFFGLLPYGGGMASLEALSVSFMLIGVVFSYHVRGQITALQGWLAGLGLTALFLISWQVSVSAAQYPNVTANYLYAVVLFTAAYGMRRHFRPVRALDFIAAISFPLYVIHALLGYSLLKVFTLAWGIGYLPSLILSLAVVILVATSLHMTVERWSIAAGRRLARRVIPKPLMSDPSK